MKHLKKARQTLLLIDETGCTWIQSFIASRRPSKRRCTKVNYVHGFCVVWLLRENEDPETWQSLYGMDSCLIGYRLFKGRGRGSDLTPLVGFVWTLLMVWANRNSWRPNAWFTPDVKASQNSAPVKITRKPQLSCSHQTHKHFCSAPVYSHSDNSYFSTSKNNFTSSILT